MDVWSAGILMYHMISGSYPFTAPDLHDKICTSYVTFDHARFSKTSAIAKDLIRKLLTKNPTERFTASDGL